MTEGENSLMWFCLCLAVRITTLDEDKANSHHEPEFVELLDQTIALVRVVYEGDMKQFLDDLVAEIEDEIKHSTKTQVIARIKQWVSGLQHQFNTNV